jgi:hypothetical protein
MTKNTSVDEISIGYNRNFTKVSKFMWLLLIELEKEVADVNGNEMCTDRTLWNILCEMSAPH